MSLINAWWTRTANGAAAPPRRAVVACDVCVPPNLAVAYTSQELSASGWRFRALEGDHHRCPNCRHAREGETRRRAAPRDQPALPNLVVIGSGKCGTSSLHSYLAEHPEIQMSDPKELRFFIGPGWRDKLSTYSTHFDGRARIRGESSPAYSIHPLIQGVPDRIADAIPDARLIYLVRDPVERTVSHLMERAYMWDGGSFERELGDLEDPYNLYVASASYTAQLQRFLKVFPRDRLLIVDNADLLRRRRGTLRDVFRFLEADENFWSPRFEVLHKPGERKTVWRRGGRRLARSRVAASARRLVPASSRSVVSAPLKRVATRRIERPNIDERTRERLRAVFAPEVERLRELTGRPFASWSV